MAVPRKWWMDRSLLVAILVGAFIRVLPLVVWQHWSCARDECTYLRLAGKITNGQGMVQSAGWLWAPGYPMLMADQRGSAGYGRAFRDAEVGDYDRGVLFDIEAMAAFLKSQPSVDPDRVAVMGLSHGGYRALFALTRRTEMFAAGIDLMGPTDRRRFVNRSRLFHIGSSPDVDPDLYRRISPIALVGRLEAPLLIIHSDADENVAPAQSYELADALDRHHKEFEMVVYQGEAHGLADPAHQLDSYRRILAFLELHIGR